MWFSPVLIGQYASEEFPELEEEGARELHDYLLNITLSRGLENIASVGLSHSQGPSSLTTPETTPDAARG